MTRMKRDQPAVSLLVPVYNVEKYLSRCLESARDQTLENIEVICINDGSTDRSPEIIREFVEADARFRSVDKENSGYGASMNMGLRAARGKYVGILESDDFIEPQFLEILFNTAEKNKAEVVKSNFFFYWSSPKEKNELFELVTPSMANRLVSPQEEQDIFYLKPSIWSAIYRRDFLLENSIDFLETPGASYQDAGFNFKVWASAVRVVYLHEAYLHYRTMRARRSTLAAKFIAFAMSTARWSVTLKKGPLRKRALSRFSSRCATIATCGTMNDLLLNFS